MKKIFKYLEPIWLGRDNKIAIKSILAITFSVNLISNLHHAIYKWDAGRSLGDLSSVLMIEAMLIGGLLGIKAVSDWANHKVESEANNPQPDNITVQSADTVSTASTKADVVNTDNIETVNTNNINTKN